MTRARRCGLVAPHAGCAAAAFSTAARNSALEASATLAWTSPVIGSNTSADRPEVPLTSRPPIKCPIVRMRSSQDLDGQCRFGRHLAVFTAFGKGPLKRNAFAKMRGWRHFQWLTTNVECDR